MIDIPTLSENKKYAIIYVVVLIAFGLTAQWLMTGCDNNGKKIMEYINNSECFKAEQGQVIKCKLWSNADVNESWKNTLLNQSQLFNKS